MSKRIYAEIGLGNEKFISTEVEEVGGERRVPGFILPKKIDDYYLRIWVFRKVYIFSTKDGFKIRSKDRNKFKVLFGISGLE